jgi:hypothetical protein
MKHGVVSASADVFKIRVKKSQARFKRVRNPDGPDVGIGTFFLLLDITAAETIYIPTSIASGKKPTGFVYQIEGTGEGDISTTNISCKGAGVTQVTLGTIVYTKVPKGTTATFRILIEMKGAVGKAYRIVIHRINYKHNAADARYQKFETDIATNMVKFR